MYNTAKVEYLLCGSLEDKEKVKTRANGFLQICGKGWEGACADGVFPVSVVVMCL